MRFLVTAILLLLLQISATTVCVSAQRHTNACVVHCVHPGTCIAASVDHGRFPLRYLPKGERSDWERLLVHRTAFIAYFPGDRAENARYCRWLRSTNKTHHPYYYRIHSRHRVREKKSMLTTT